MTPAVLKASRHTSWGASEMMEIDGDVEGVLVAGLREEVMSLLEGVFERRLCGKGERVVRDVWVRVGDGGLVRVAAYVFRER